MSFAVTRSAAPRKSRYPGSYDKRGIGTSVAESSDLDPGADQRIDRRYRFTEQAVGPSTNQASDMVRSARRRSSVTAARRYQWSQGGSAGALFGRRQAAASDRLLNQERQISDVESISRF